MAVLTLNNQSDAKNLICFNSCPNIIRVEQTAGTVTYAYATFNITNNLIPTDTNKISRIIVNGNAVIGTEDVSKVNGRRFYRRGSNKIKFCALSLTNALKSIPDIVMNYDIIFDQESKVTITAKNPGSMYNLDIVVDNLSNFNYSKYDGSTSDNLIGNYFSRVYLDLYYNNTGEQRQINATGSESDYTYLTTLQKEYYKDSVSFNVSPALQSVSSNDNTTIWRAKLYAMVDSNVVDLEDITDNYIINGYLVNQGGTYINASSEGEVLPALNVQRGNDRTMYNKTLLYIYENNFPISIYKIAGKTRENVTISYKESDEVEIASRTQTFALTTDKNIDTYTITLDDDLMRDSYFIDITFSFGVIRLNVINPPFANAECNRVYWYNSYGGVSFFDFLGDKVDERKSEVTTYNKSLLDFYKNDKQEQAVVYFRENDMTVSLTSHLIEKDGLYLLYDLQNSYKAWITINNVPYYIIIDSLTINEPSDNIYTATIKYKYSLLDSFA